MKRDSLVTIVLLALIGYLVSCLRTQQTQMMDTVEKATSRIAADSQTQTLAISTSYTTSIREVTGRLVSLTELLMLGRDSQTSNESLPRSETESPVSTEPEIDLSDLPETAAWAMQEEDLLQMQTPWQSSTPPSDSELTL